MMADFDSVTKAAHFVAGTTTTTTTSTTTTTATTRKAYPDNPPEC